MRNCDRLAGFVQEEQAGQLRLRIYFYCQLYLWKMGSHQYFERFLRHCSNWTNSLWTRVSWHLEERQYNIMVLISSFWTNLDSVAQCAFASAPQPARTLFSKVVFFDIGDRTTHHDFECFLFIAASEQECVDISRNVIFSLWTNEGFVAQCAFALAAQPAWTLFSKAAFFDIRDRTIHHDYWTGWQL